jgi:hypothetical protein
MRLSLCALVLIGVGLGGCHDLGKIKPALTGDGGPAHDGNDAADAAVDAVAPDSPAEDLSRDSTPATDTGGDTVVDAGMDLGDGSAAQDGGCQSNDQCPALNVCVVATHACVPSAAVIQGRVYPYESTNVTAVLPGVTVAITSTKAYLQSDPSDPTGHYSINNVPLGSVVDFNLTLPQTLVGTQILIPASLATRVSAVLGNMTSETFDLPLVNYAWLANVAYRCGVYMTAAEATMTSGHLNFDFTTRSTIVGTLLDAGGHPVAGVSRDAISVSMAATAMALYPNTNDNPADNDHGLAAHVCFLGADSTAGQYVGTTSTVSTATGKFVVFRVRNTRGTGEGTAQVQATGFVSQTVILQSTANLGVVTLSAGQDAVPVEKVRNFEKDVYPLFTKYTCIGCHSPNNNGFTISMPRGPMSLRLDLSDTPTKVWTALTTGGFTGCEGTTPARVCPPAPDASLLLKKPLAETGGTPPDHANSSFQTTADPDYRIIADWIKQGASR